MSRLNSFFCLFLVFLFLLSSIINAAEYNYDSEGNIGPEIDIVSGINIAKDLNTAALDINFNLAYIEQELSIDELYMQTDLFNGRLSVGRRYYKLGPGHFSQLMLSDQGTSLDLIMHEGDFAFYGHSFGYSMLVAYLDEGVNKYFFAHRVSNDTIIPGLEIGLAESMVAHKILHPIYYLPVPFVPYYLTTYIIGQDTIYHNYSDKYIGMDFRYIFANKAELYGELLVDEYPQSSHANNPDKRAHLLGFYYPYSSKTDFRIEYSNVFNYIYLHRHSENRYSVGDDYLGHWLGHDGDVIDLELIRKIDNYQSISLGLRYLRCGIGDMETDYIKDHQEKKFLYEISSSTAMLRGSYYREFNETISFDIGFEIAEEYFKEGNEKDLYNFRSSINIKL